MCGQCYELVRDLGWPCPAWSWPFPGGHGAIGDEAGDGRCQAAVVAMGPAHQLLSASVVGESVSSGEPVR